MIQSILTLLWLLIEVQCHPLDGAITESPSSFIQIVFSKTAVPRPSPWVSLQATTAAEIDVAPTITAPTSVPKNVKRDVEFFQKRGTGNNTCGYISGISISSVTCNNPNYVCATNTYYSVRGCCDPSSLAECSIPTTCIPSSLLDSCTGSCPSNAYIAKCTNPSAPYCHEWLYIYGTTRVITEFGCAPSADTISVFQTYSGESSIVSSRQLSSPQTTLGATVASSSPSLPSPSATPSGSPTGGKSFPTDFSLGAKVGCIIGASSVVAFFLWWRWPKFLRCSRKREASVTSKQEVSEINPFTNIAGKERVATAPEVLSTNSRNVLNITSISRSLTR